MSQEKKTTEKSKKKVGFEESLKRLEEIVTALEHGQLTLEESMACFEEGMKLSQFCQEKLREAQTRIEVLVSRPDGTKEWEPASHDLTQVYEKGAGE